MRGEEAHRHRDPLLCHIDIENQIGPGHQDEEYSRKKDTQFKPRVG